MQNNELTVWSAQDRINHTLVLQPETVAAAKAFVLLVGVEHDFFCAADAYELFRGEFATEHDDEQWAEDESFNEFCSRFDVVALIAAFCPAGWGVTQHGHDDFAIEPCE